MAGKGKKILTYGCFGCLGVIVLTAVCAAVVMAIAWSGKDPVEIEEQSIVQDLPEPGETAFQPDEVQDAAREMPAMDPDAAALIPAGRVVLDLANAEFVIEPGEPGESIQVEARYDRNAYKLEEELVPDGAGDGVFLSRISFRQSGSSTFMAAIRELITGSKPRVEVRLPPDIPLDLEMSIRQGSAQVELGGLWLVKGEVAYKQGGMAFKFSRPLRQPMELLSVSGSMGGGALEGIGNASPKVLEIEYSMGGMAADLGGAWRCDSQVRVHGSMGGGALMIPDDITVVGAPGASLREPSREELPGPTLHLDVSSEMGELEIVRQ